MPDLIDRLNTRYPIWNAGMGGGIASAELVAGVCEAGGFGVLGSGAMPRAQILEMVEQTRALTSRPFGANIILPMSNGEDVEACFDARVPVMVLFWGDPQPYLADAHKRDMAVVVQCGGPEDAAAAASAGVDAVIIQGTEAGGHVKATERLEDNLRETVTALGKLPVIAAGGIATGAAIASVLAAGARAASLGTRFVACKEAAAIDAYKSRVVEASSDQTVLTDLFDLGWPQANHRVLRNKTYDDWEAAGRPDSGQRPGEGDEVGSVPTADDPMPLPRYTVLPPIAGFEGDLEAMPLYAGESVDQIDGLLDTATIMAQLVEELRTASA